MRAVRSGGASVAVTEARSAGALFAALATAALAAGVALACGPSLPPPGPGGPAADGSAGAAGDPVGDDPGEHDGHAGEGGPSGGGDHAGHAGDAGPAGGADHEGHAGHAGHGDPGDATGTATPEWRMPPMERAMPMLPSLMGSVPPVEPFLPGAGIDPATLPAAAFREVVEMEDGDTLRLEAGLVRRTINGRTLVMYGFNGQYPGPLIRAPQDATIVVDFHNATALPTTVHWHGVRLDNRFDGVPGVTQDPVEPGGSFVYRVHFRDAGIYWYHPHHREDISQDLGLYGNMMVTSPDPEYFNPVNAEEILMLDDLLVDARGLFPFGRESSTHALMGRFGNVLLVNGESEYRLDARAGEVVRFFLTNVSNTRVFNLSFDGARVKVVGSDVGRFEREEWVESVVLAPAERYVVEVLWEEPGTHTVTNRIQAIDHYRGEFYPRVDTLGTVRVAAEAPTESHLATFRTLRVHEDVVAGIDPFRRHFDRPPDRELEIGVEVGALPLPFLQMMAVDTFYFHAVEWNDVMPMMNYISTGETVEWFLEDAATGARNMEIDWRFRVGDVVKIRIRNEPTSIHPMHHPIHLHGQRFLVLEQDGARNPNLVWKDTAVVPLGSTVDLLVEMSNPGDWMLHCHISEHLETGMKMLLRVDPA